MMMMMMMKIKYRYIITKQRDGAYYNKGVFYMLNALRALKIPNLIFLSILHYRRAFVSGR
jgi:hypothetical protein